MKGDENYTRRKGNKRENNNVWMRKTGKVRERKKKEVKRSKERTGKLQEEKRKIKQREKTEEIRKNI